MTTQIKKRARVPSRAQEPQHHCDNQQRLVLPLKHGFDSRTSPNGGNNANPIGKKCPVPEPLAMEIASEKGRIGRLWVFYAKKDIMQAQRILEQLEQRAAKEIDPVKRQQQYAILNAMVYSE
ncbi:MAG: hypothetical protein ACLQVY_11580 [Limisphaerales bacterium]